MNTATEKKKLTIPYVKILNERPKAVQIDIGEHQPVWFPLYAITIDKNDFTITGDESFIQEKLDEGAGVVKERNPHDDQMIQLAKPSWENDKSIGIDVVISRKDSKHIIKDRIFVAKKMLQDGCIPLWMATKKEQEAIDKSRESGFYRNDDFYVSGFRAKEKP